MSHSSAEETSLAIPPVSGETDVVGALRRSAEGMAIVGPEGRVQEANAALGRLLGYEAGELVGLTLDDLTPEEERAANRRLGGRTGSSGQRESRLRRKNGQEIWVRLTATRLPAPGGQGRRLLQVQDITRRREAEAALRHGDDRLRALLRNSSEAVEVLDERGRLRFAGSSYPAVFGVPESEALGRDVMDSIHPDDRALARNALLRARDADGVAEHAVVRRRVVGGMYRWFEITIANLLDEPAVRGVVVNSRDIQDRTENLADQIGALADEALAAEARAAVQRKSEFIALLSHEFRSPLTAIQGYGELLAGRISDPDEIAEFATVIADQAAQMAKMIDDMLLLDQMQDDELPLQLEDTDVNRVVRDVAAHVHDREPRREIRLALDKRLPAVAADRDRLAQVVAALIGNALKYSPEGSRITIRTNRERKAVHVAITDEGVGIPRDSLERVFDRFERVYTGRTQTVVGAGLGLSIVREIVRLHGGKVWAESTEGAGSTFHVRLPARQLAASA
ncbi:MAG: PAS domain S-box protein [Thermomicrobiales bacterium]|nr:PAS domain S-box protein [Thermomicrobiales bacterium]